MRKLVVLLFLLAGAACVVLVLTGVPFAPPAVKKASLPKELRDSITYIRQQKKESGLKVFFSHQDFFYDTPIQVSMSANQPGAEIYYTLDGSEPTARSAVYTAPIALTLPDETACTVIRAMAVLGEEQSRVLTHSYFLGRDALKRFSSYVFSLSTNPDNFFGYERGILVPGKIYDDYMRGNDKPNSSFWRRPANYNEHGKAWERPVFVEAFTPSGKRITGQNAGARVLGESSRGAPQKSLRLIARKSYEPKYGKFKYPFFPELTQDNGYGASIFSYDNLALGTGGSIYGSTRLIDSLVTRLAREAGYVYASPVRSAAVFINGGYYGHSWLTARLNEQYFKVLYGVPENSFEVLEGGEHKVYTKNPFLRHEFWQLHQYARQDMNDEAVFMAFSNAVDVGNLLWYMAIELYTANSDWPRSNVRIWRYAGEREEDLTLPEALDGRWRYILFDVQQAMGTEPLPADNVGSRAHFSYKSIQFAQREIPFLSALFKRPDLVREFSNYMCDLAFTHFSEEKVTRTARDLLDESRHEFAYAATRSVGPGVPDILDILEKERERMILFSRERPGYVIDEMREVFGYTDLFTIELEGPGRINTIRSGKGRYFVESVVPVTAEPPKWRAFDHWLVNGQKRVEEPLLISGADAVDGKVHIKLVTRDDTPGLFISDPYDKGKLCGFSLRNSRDESLTTEGLYLSDKPHKLKKWRIPDFTVAPEGKIDFVGQSYRSTDAILKVQLNFNPRRGEVVYLSDERGKVLDYTIVP